MNHPAAPSPAPAPSVPPAGRPPKARWGLASSALSAVLAGLASVVVLPVVAVGTAYAVLRTEAGTAWLLPRLPGLHVERPQGALLGPRFGAARVAFDWAGGQAGVVVEELRVEGAQWRWWLRPGVWAGLQAQSLSAARVQVRSGPRAAAPPQLPTSLDLPLELQVQRVEVAELQVDQHPALRALRAGLHLGARESTGTGTGTGTSTGATRVTHRVEQLEFEWDRLRARATARVDTQRPFALQATAEAASTGPGPAWRAEASASGPLEGFEMRATLRGTPLPGAPAPALDAVARVLPLARWPLGRLEATTRGLDLAALFSRAPHTRLSGRVVLAPREEGRPLAVALELDNALPGRMGEQRVPVRRLRATLQAPSVQLERLDAGAVELVLGTEAGEAGRWQASGTWQGSTLNLESRVIDLRPHLIDPRAPALRVSGPLKMSWSGLALPRPAGAAATAAPLSTAAVSFSGELQGALDARPQAVTLGFEGRADARQFELVRLRAAAGAASADFSARLAPAADGRGWQARSEGRLAGFDPLVWFPGPEGSAWRRGPHRLNASWNLALTVPPGAFGLPPLQALQSIQGQGALDFGDSLVAGVPMEGSLVLAQDPSAPVAQRSRLQGRLRLGPNVVEAEGSGDPAGDGQADRLRLVVNAPALAAVAPLAALHPDLARWAPQQGSVEASLWTQGRWPALRTEGQARLRELRAAELSLASGSVSWRVASGRDEPVSLQAELLQARVGVLRASVLRASVDGTLRAHRLVLDGAAPVQPSAALERSFGLKPAAGTQARLQGSGGWEGVPAGGGTWRGSLERLSVGVWDGSTERRATPDASWVDARELNGEVRFAEDWSVAAVQAAAGRATLAGGVPLRWDEVRYRAHTAHPDLELRAEIAPVAVLPFLQRARTGLQWTGDLRMAARVDIRAGERLQADITLQRHDGDLQVVESGSSPQPLGLSDAQLALSVRDGLWRFTPRLIGSQLGQVSGSVSARTRPELRWPAADAPLEGTVNLQVPNLGVWAGWVPPGWRIAGELATVARVGGQFGAPQLNGELRASRVAVRNLLQGVDYSDGELLVALTGDTARIERFTLRGGEGTLSAEGSAKWADSWSSFSAQLTARARNFRAIGRVDRQLVTSGEGSLQFRPDQLRIGGRLVVDSGLVDLSRRDAPTLDEDVTVLRASEQSEEPVPVAAQRPLLRNAQVALDLDLGEKLRLRFFGVDTGLRGQLRLSTPAGRLSVVGAVRAEDGTYTGYGQKMEIERGVVTLAGPLELARLDILALRPKIDARVGVSITGPVLNPRVKLYSEPAMSEGDKLSWLVLGRAPEGLGRADTELLTRAATALLAGQGEAPTDTFLRALGLDDLSFRQTDGDTRDTIIRLGKQLSRRWYVGYERGVNATGGTFQIIYRIAQQFTLRAQSGLENSLDIIWTWRFDESFTPRPPVPAPGVR
ncbi:MAG: translocation/assembly module TamB domain-containing protein [Rubrivivax sp.]